MSRGSKALSGSSQRVTRGEPVLAKASQHLLSAQATCDADVQLGLSDVVLRHCHDLESLENGWRMMEIETVRL